MSSRLDRLAIFGHFWAVACISSGLRWFSEDSAWGWPMLLAATFLLLRPRSLLGLIGVMLTKIVFVIDVHPFCPNHLLFESLIDVAALATFGMAFLSDRRKRQAPALIEAFRSRAFETFAAAARVSLLLLYFFTVLHKLNRDFFDLESSCGPFLLDLMRARLQFPAPEWVQMLTVWGTLAIEIAIPLGLCFRRTRRLAIVLGLVLHGALAQLPNTGLYSFSTMMFGLYFLFLSPGFTDDLHRRFSVLKDRLPLRRQAYWVVPLLLIVLFAAGVVADTQGRLKLFGLLLWDVWFVGLVVIGAGPFRSASAVSTFPGLLCPRPALLWILPLVVFFNGMNPYIGLKTLTSFAMLSNLRTEGGETNHFFMRRWIWLSHYQDDLVEVLETDHSELSAYRDEDLLITFHEFRRICSSSSRDFRVAYLRHGAAKTLEVRGGKSSDVEVTRPLDRWRAWYFGFRAVDAGPRMGCRK